MSEKETIIVADDSTPIQKVIKIALSKMPFEIMCCGNYSEAQTLIRTKNPGILIVDAGLPGLQGIEDFKSLTTSKQNQTIILLGSYEKYSAQNFHELGFSHILKKPFSTQDLNDLIAKIYGPLGPVIDAVIPPPPPPMLVKKESILPPPPHVMNTQNKNDSISREMKDYLQGEIKKYCEENFKEIAREVLSTEIKRLMLEKSRVSLE